MLRNRQYLLWLASSNAATVGYSVYAISVVWLAYTRTHSFAVVGLVLFVEYAAYSLAFLLGPIADRVRNQRSVYLACYPVQAAAAALLGVSAKAGFLSVPLLIALIGLISLLWDIPWAAFNAAPRILLAPEEQFAAEGVSGAIGGANSIAGYTLGGALILLVGAYGGMLLYAGLLVTAAILALGLRIHPEPSTGTRFGQSFREGWRTIASGAKRPLPQLASVDAIQGFFMSGTALFITLLAASTFHASGVAYGLLFTASILGGVAAGLALGWSNPRGRAGVVMVGSLLGCGLALAAAGALPPVLVLTALLWLVIGFASNGYLDAKYAFLRGSVAPNQLGRVTSNLYLFPGISSAVGALLLGVLAGRLPPLYFGLVLGLGFLSAGTLALILPGVKVMRY
ncbi:MAG TPA: hypothetical protein VGS23_01745 [Thermoplasmata archaeon]|nr:hypothetical protein [Thermoplasmata archaeon]